MTTHAACTCAEMRARHRPPAPNDPNQTPSQVRCPWCCEQSFNILIKETR